MIPAWQASLRAQLAETWPPVSMQAAFRPPIRVARGMVTTTVAARPPAWGSSVGGVGLEVLAERPSHPLRRRPAGSGVAVDGGAVLGGGDRQQGLLEHGAVQGGQGELAVDLPVPVPGHRQPGRGCGVTFLFGELLLQLGVRHLRSQGGEDAFAEDPQLTGCEVGGLGRPGPRRPWRAGPGRGRRGGPRPHARSPGACSTFTSPAGEPDPDRLEQSVVEGLGQPHQTTVAGRSCRVTCAHQFAVDDAATRHRRAGCRRGPRPAA